MRTPDAAAGKKGRCPHCGELTRIPSTSQTSASESQRRLAPSATVTSDRSIASRSQSDRIEFPCPQCHKQVRTPASAAGKKGKCPKCGAVLQIPAGKARSAGESRQEGASLTPLGGDTGGLLPLGDDSSGLTPLPDDTGGLTRLPDSAGLTPLEDDGGLVPLDPDPLGGDPFWTAGGAAPNPFSDAYAPAAAPAYSRSPYQSPTYASRGRQGVNEWVVKAPAIAMMAVGGLNMLIMIPYILVSTFGAAGAGPGVDGENPAEMIGFGVGVVIVLLIIAALYALIIFGGWKMFKMETWGLALTGAILMVIPCTVCWMGLPVGIWAIVVLSLSDVRRAFG